MKLSKTQTKLLAELQSGATLHYMRYMGSFNPTPYYYASVTNKRCTKAAEKLIELGLVVKTKEHPWSDPEFNLTEAGKTFVIPQPKG